MHLSVRPERATRACEGDKLESCSSWARPLARLLWVAEKMSSQQALKARKAFSDKLKSENDAIFEKVRRNEGTGAPLLCATPAN